MDLVHLDHNWYRSELALDPALEIQFARDTFIVNLCSVAALTWVLYDMVLCFGQEISLVWRRWGEYKGRHSRRIYVIVRYFSVLNLAWYVGVNTGEDLNQRFCQAWHFILVINTTVITLLPDTIVLIRINSAYGWNHTTSLISILVFLTQVITSLGIGVLSVMTTGRPSIKISTMGCPLGTPKYNSMMTLAAWIPSIVAQGIYFLMMLAIFFRVLQDIDPKGKANKENLLQVRRLVPTMVVFICNGSCYFFIAIITKIVNAVVVVNVSGPLKGVGIPIMMALYPVLVTRTYLTMVAYLHQDRNSLDHDNDKDTVCSFIRPNIESGQITFAKSNEDEY